MVKVKVKLTGEQCGYIASLIQDTDVKIIHKDITAMVNDLMLEILEKLHGRSLWMDKNYSINLTPAQGRAFILYFSQVDLSALPYEQNLVRQTIALINQTLTNKTKPVYENTGRIRLAN